MAERVDPEGLVVPEDLEVATQHTVVTAHLVQTDRLDLLVTPGAGVLRARRARSPPIDAPYSSSNRDPRPHYGCGRTLFKIRSLLLQPRAANVP
jgi:hypothetical protein